MALLCSVPQAVGTASSLQTRLLAAVETKIPLLWAISTSFSTESRLSHFFEVEGWTAKALLVEYMKTKYWVALEEDIQLKACIVKQVYLVFNTESTASLEICVELMWQDPLTKGSWGGGGGRHFIARTCPNGGRGG